MNVNIGSKLIGLVSCTIGAGLLYLEYKIVLGIGALGAWIGELIGATGDAQTGIAILIGLLLMGALMVPLVFAGGAFVFGISMCSE